ncbi:MAG: hypothetical protein WCH01_21610 [Methylococcaceae bacterium]
MLVQPTPLYEETPESYAKRQAEVEWSSPSGNWEANPTSGPTRKTAG